MSKKKMFKTDNSYITIMDDKLYILSNKYRDYSPRAVMVIPGFQIELGRDINDIITALKETRLPVIIKSVIEKGDKHYYHIIRMETGNVDDKIIASVVCSNNIIHTISFNRTLLKDSNYRRYNKVSIFHQLSLPYSLAESNVISRGEQVRNAVITILGRVKHIEVNESQNKLVALINDEDIKIKLTFILDSTNNRYALSSISLQ